MTAGAHFLIGWALWILAVSPPLPLLSQPLWVALVAAEAPAAAPERPLPAPRPQPAPTPPMAEPLAPPPVAPDPPPDLRPLSNASPAQSAPSPAPRVAAEAPPAAVVAPAPPPPAPSPAPPPAPKLLRADQVRYLVLPPAETPLLSRRAGESGVVWLRVRIDTEGRPARIALHRSSGFRRLDEQALAAMAQARFVPRLEDGVAVEVEVIAPIEYAAE